MSRLMRIRVMALLGALLVSGCSGGQDTAPLMLEALRSGYGAVTARTGGQPAATQPVLTRAVLDTMDGSIIEITRERLGVTAFLLASGVRQDDLPGRITIWRTGDDVTLSTRNGVLVQTRGLGGDILSSRVQVADGQPGPATGGVHEQMIRSLDNRMVRLNMACDLEDLGSVTIEIVERRHATRHLRQKCAGNGGEIVNDYWVDAGAGVVWKSRQWAGPYIGYLRFRRLTR